MRAFMIAAALAAAPAAADVVRLTPQSPCGWAMPPGLQFDLSPGASIVGGPTQARSAFHPDVYDFGAAQLADLILVALWRDARDARAAVTLSRPATPDAAPAPVPAAPVGGVIFGALAALALRRFFFSRSPR